MNHFHLYLRLILYYENNIFIGRLIENKYFESVVLALILLSSGVMTLEDITFDSKPMLVDTLFYLDKILTVVFLIETVLKLFSMGFVAYFSNAWCWLDFVIVGVSLINFSAGLLGFANISIFKVIFILLGTNKLTVQNVYSYRYPVYSLQGFFTHLRQ